MAAARRPGSHWPGDKKTAATAATAVAIVAPGPHFAPKAKHVIYLHMVGRAVTDGSVRLQAADERVLRQGPAGHRSAMGQRLTTMTCGPDAVSDRAVEVQVRAAWQARHVGQRAASEQGEEWSTSMCFIRSMHTEAINHEPAITLHADRATRSRAGPAWARGPRYGLGSVNADLADVRRAGRQAHQHRTGAGDLRAALAASAYLPGEHAGVSFRSAATPSCTSTIPTAWTPRCAARRSTALQGAQRNEATSSWAIPKRTRASQQYELAFRMQSSVPDLHRTSAASRSPPHKLYGDDAQEARHICATRRCSRAAWSSAASASSRSITTTGTRTPTWRGRLPDQCRDVDQAVLD